MPLFGVRAVVKFQRSARSYLYEERITIWHARDFDDAIERAAAETNDYIKDIDGVDTDFYQAYEIYPLVGDIPDGAEVFSLMRDSELDTDSYIARYFSTGEEHEGHIA